MLSFWNSKKSSYVLLNGRWQRQKYNIEIHGIVSKFNTSPNMFGFDQKLLYSSKNFTHINQIATTHNLRINLFCCIIEHLGVSFFFRIKKKIKWITSTQSQWKIHCFLSRFTLIEPSFCDCRKRFWFDFMQKVLFFTESISILVPAASQHKSSS